MKTFSDSFIISCSILSIGMMFNTHLNGLMELHKLHIDLKNKQKIKYDDCYWHYFSFSFVLGISGILFMNKFIKN